MKRHFFVFLILFFPSISLAQIQIGDIKVKSMSELFDKGNTTLWNAFGAFNKTDSKVWISSIPSLLIDSGNQKAIILAFKKDLDQDSIRTVIISQLNEQFGEFDKAEIPGLSEYSSLEWKKEENGTTYFFSISADKSIGALNIIRN
ncbi:MAG: hypothetical protein ACMZ7B_05255 [Balneola sp.]